MRRQIIATALACCFAAAPFAARAQVIRGTENGAANGANEGERVGGPIGGLVGGAVGAGVGAATGALGTAGNIVGGVLGVDERPRFREFAVRERRPSFAFREPLRAGVVLPTAGVVYYDVPPEYHTARGYRYTIVNERPVIVDPRTRRAVEILD